MFLKKGRYLKMKKEDFVKLGIDEETAKKCETASQEKLKGFIPKVRFDEVNNEKKKLELDLRDRDGQLETLKNSTGDVEAMKQQIATLQADNKANDDAHAAEIKKMKVDAAVDAALTNSGAINTKAVVPFLKDMDKAELAEDGTVKGLAEQEIQQAAPEQGLKEPCFSIVCVNPTNELFRGKKYFRKNLFCIFQ